MTRDPLQQAGASEPGRSSMALERSNTRLSVLAEVSHAFATVATNYDSLLEKIAQTVAQLVGDGCQVTLIDAAGATLLFTLGDDP